MSAPDGRADGVAAVDTEPGPGADRSAEPTGPAEGSRPDDQPTVSGASVRTLWRRHRVIVFVMVGIVVVATAIGIAQTRSVGGRLDPRSADRDGGRALAVLLDERGVRVERVTEPAALTAAATDRTAVLAAFPGLLGDNGARSVGELSSGTVVLVSPAVDILEAVTDDLRREGSSSVHVRDPGCPEPAAAAAGRALIGGTTFSTDGGTTCYRDEGDYAPLVIGRTRGGARLVAIGTGQGLTNERLDEEGNAALALNLLGADGSASELRWLVAAPGGATGE